MLGAAPETALFFVVQGFDAHHERFFPGRGMKGRRKKEARERRHREKKTGTLCRSEYIHTRTKSKSETRAPTLLENNLARLAIGRTSSPYNNSRPVASANYRDLHMLCFGKRCGGRNGEKSKQGPEKKGAGPRRPTKNPVDLPFSVITMKWKWSRWATRERCNVLLTRPANYVRFLRRSLPVT